MQCRNPSILMNWLSIAEILSQSDMWKVKSCHLIN
jgi:hypothetical protein